MAADFSKFSAGEERRGTDLDEDFAAQLRTCERLQSKRRPTGDCQHYLRRAKLPAYFIPKRSREYELYVVRQASQLSGETLGGFTLAYCYWLNTARSATCRGRLNPKFSRSAQTTHYAKMDLATMRNTRPTAQVRTYAQDYQLPDEGDARTSDGAVGACCSPQRYPPLWR